MTSIFLAGRGHALAALLLRSLGVLGGFCGLPMALGCSHSTSEPSALPATSRLSSTQPVHDAQPSSTPASSALPPPTPAPPVQPHPPAVTGPSCALKGTSPVAKGTLLFDAAVDGRVVASFTGNYVPMTLSEIPTDPGNSRARLATSAGTASLRLEGYVPTSAISVFTTRDTPVVTGNVWISGAYRVKLVAVAPTSVTVEITVAGSRNQKVRAITTCDALALQGATPTPMEVPGDARGYLTKASSTDLFNHPNGDVRFTLQVSDGSPQLFWSTETKPGFVHVQSRADLTIDGWIRANDLDPLKVGETMDRYIPPQTRVMGAQLAIDKAPRIVKAAKEIPVRARRDEKEKPIGVVETDAEIYVMETVAGWTNVLPKSLFALPPDDGGFWIPSSETPK